MNDSMTSVHAGPGLLARRRSVFWRIHFWAALIASPFVLIAPLTSALYIFTARIKARLYGHLEQVTHQARCWISMLWLRRPFQTNTRMRRRPSGN
jgi:uncharacterized iron-regulated membrane protein